MYTLAQKKQEHLEVKRKNRPKLLKTLPTGRQVVQACTKSAKSEEK
jgi:hypothetical protein